MSNRNVFSRTGSLRPGRSVFDLSYSKKFTCDMGQLIPVACDECIPSDYWEISAQALVRFQPLVAPIMHEINLYAYSFFVPYRILDEDFEEAITGGEDGDSTLGFPEWNPTNNAKGSLWDFLGFPVNIDPELTRPLDYPRRSYNLIYNTYFRDENLQAEVPLTNELILNRAWEKDYFTSALPWQQRSSIAPALPISGLVSVHGIGTLDQTYGGSAAAYETGGTRPTYTNAKLVGDAATDRNFYVEEDPSHPGYPNIRADLSGASTFDVADLRLAFQVQKWLERNARAGVRYTEFLQSHFGVGGNLDSRLQRPEYIGGLKQGIIISEVLQTSSTDATSPQGNLAGHGITATNGRIGKYHVKEFGLIMTIMSIMPRSSYQDGINRQWLRKTKYDFPFPEFVNLSEQAIEEVEICAHDGNTTNNQRIFGYQGRYDECRTKDNMVCSDMRDTFDYWHLGRQFDPSSPPALNSAFITCTPRKDIFAAPSEPGLIVDFGNVIKAVRPLPIAAEPGLIDHN